MRSTFKEFAAIRLRDGDGEAGSAIPVFAARSRRKSLGLEIRPDGSVLARVPYLVTDRELKRFLEGHREWIIQKSILVRKKNERREEVHAPLLEELSAKERKLVREKILERVSFYSHVMGITVGRVSVRDQKTRWGSCSIKGNVNFNYLLAFLPEELLDYVVVHELAHRRYMNHSKEFWSEVQRYCPDYKDRRKRLKQYSLHSSAE